jgi:hypothetical protein
MCLLPDETYFLLNMMVYAARHHWAHSGNAVLCTALPDKNEDVSSKQVDA